MNYRQSLLFENTISDRFQNYQGEHCWQYDIKLKNQKSIDKPPHIPDFNELTFSYIPADNVSGCNQVKSFIKKNEWVGKMPTRVTHRFTATHDNKIIAATVMATPNTFSKLLGKGTENLEKLIARGASYAWAPKNIGSWITMKAINWMVDNTPYRVFTAYADPEAKELGTIYQACNFHYLGQTYGTTKQYYDPENPRLGWFSDRLFRQRSRLMRYAKTIGYTLPHIDDKVDRASIPLDIKKRLKEEEKKYISRCLVRETPLKHKYVYVKAPTPNETRKLIKQLQLNSKTYPYPKTRG